MFHSLVLTTTLLISGLAMANNRNAPTTHPKCISGVITNGLYQGEVEKRQGDKKGQISLLTKGGIWKEGTPAIFSPEDDNWLGRVNVTIKDGSGKGKTVIFEDNANEFHFSVPKEYINRICADSITLLADAKGSTQPGTELRVFKVQRRITDRSSKEVTQKCKGVKDVQAIYDQETLVYDVILLITLKQGKEMITLRVKGSETEVAEPQLRIACPAKVN